MHEVLLERAAERDLKRLSLTVYDRIVPHLKALSQNPRPTGCKKIAGSRSDWRIRIGDYRVIYEIDDRTKVVTPILAWLRRPAKRLERSKAVGIPRALRCFALKHDQKSFLAKTRQIA